jgi:hypothetical protein
MRRDALPPSAAGRCGSPRRSVVVCESFHSTSARDTTRVPFGPHRSAGGKPPRRRRSASPPAALWPPYAPSRPSRARTQRRTRARPHAARTDVTRASAMFRCASRLRRVSECRRSSATPSTCCLSSTSSSTSARREHCSRALHRQPCTRSGRSRAVQRTETRSESRSLPCAAHTRKRKRCRRLPACGMHGGHRRARALLLPAHSHCAAT